MTLQRLCLRNLFYHWRGNSAVLLGVVVGCAVLTGALLVGDSLRDSLSARTLQRLGWVDQALVAPRFFRAALAGELKADGAAKRIEPALILQATASGPTPAQARGVTVLGVTPDFLPDFDRPNEDIVWLSSALARALGAEVGQKITLRLQKPSAIPREAALGNKKVELEEWPVTVAKVLEGDEPGNLFNLRPDLEAPRNAFVHLARLQERLGKPGRANALLVGGAGPNLADNLKAHLTLEDWGLVLNGPRERADALFARLLGGRKRDTKLLGRLWAVGGKPRFASIIAEGMGLQLKRPPTLELAQLEDYYHKQHPYLSLESKQLLLDSTVGQAALAAAEVVKLRTAPTLVYLCRISYAKQRVAGVVAATVLNEKPPLGSFEPEGVPQVNDKDIVFADWGWPQKPAAGTEVTLAFKPPEDHGPAPDRTAELRLVGYIPMKGAAADPGLTPDFPGITDKDDIGQWKLPFDDPAWDNQALRAEYTDAYWDRYRATPKAYIQYTAGKQLWGSRFGDLTSIRFAAKEGLSLDETATAYRAALLKHLAPEKGGFVFDPVKKTSLEASQQGTDFSSLFLGFSFFLIASALLLVGLLYRLNLDRRASEVGLLFAEGYRRRTVAGLLLAEGGLLACVGVIAGTLLAIAYAELLVKLLIALWPGGTLQSFLRPHVGWQSLVIGAVAALFVSVLTIAWVVRSLSRVPPRALLAGQTTGEGQLGLKQGQGRWSKWIALGSLVVGLGLLAAGPFVPGGHEAQAGTFFSGGGLLLTAALAGASAWMRSGRHAVVEGAGLWSIARLGVRNAARHPARSLLTAGLLASAAFLIVAVEVFRRHASERNPGTGGFALLAESDLPVIVPLDTVAGRDNVLDKLETQLAAKGLTAAEVKEHRTKARELLEDKETKIIGFRVHGGDDASCLNLYQPRRPKLLGVPKKLIDEGGFAFAGTEASSPEEKQSPWKILERSEGPPPVFGEANTVTWQLKKGLGDKIAVPDGRGKETELLIAGLLQDSVFQSSLLMSEEHFLRLYPDTEGYNFFLIQAPPGRESDLKDLLEQALSDRGLEVTSSAERIQAYQAVENMYLTTFQALGGLGLVLGSLGLAVVLMRGVWERRGELALLRALGFRRSTLGWLVLAENGFLLVLGLSAGTVAALLAVTPHLLRDGGASIPWAALLGLLAVVLVVGLVAGAVAVVTTLRAPLVPALRRE